MIQKMWHKLCLNQTIIQNKRIKHLHKYRWRHNESGKKNTCIDCEAWPGWS